jgi:Flp pilus assembly protein TadG
MSKRNFFGDVRGATAVEFAMTAPLFLALLFAVVEGSLILWTQLGLQHGTESAARCASVNTTVCGTLSDIQNFAAKQAFGLSIPPATFDASTPACGNLVTANYSFGFIVNYFSTTSLTLTARSCYPK